MPNTSTISDTLAHNETLSFGVLALAEDLWYLDTSFGFSTKFDLLNPALPTSSYRPRISLTHPIKLMNKCTLVSPLKEHALIAKEENHGHGEETDSHKKKSPQAYGSAKDEARLQFGCYSPGSRRSRIQRFHATREARRAHFKRLRDEDDDTSCSGPYLKRQSFLSELRDGREDECKSTLGDLLEGILE
jgi:hypothetical protein